MALATHRMARATRDMVALSAEPYLSLTMLDVLVDEKLPGYAVRVHLKNPGQVRITYEVRNILVSVAGVDGRLVWQSCRAPELFFRPSWL
jgi:hypothetical protein